MSVSKKKGKNNLHSFSNYLKFEESFIYQIRIVLKENNSNRVIIVVMAQKLLALVFIEGELTFI